ncbi:MAG TPA: response regulator transcription factor [Alphaproteobacteria bacterium]|nr:response regulator transcription factor [Alphaproteobacteria bacterium]
MPDIRVMLVDDHAVVREGYRRLLERAGAISVVGEAGTSGDALACAEALRPDIAVIDVALPDASGIETTRLLQSKCPDILVLIFSMHDDAVFAAHALDAGARGYLSKASALEELVDAVVAVTRGATYLSRDVARKLAEHQDARRREPSILTERELEILQLLVTGAAVAEISQILGVSEKTVANQQSNIREKLGARNGVQLLQVACRLGLVRRSG